MEGHVPDSRAYGVGRFRPGVADLDDRRHPGRRRVCRARGIHFHSLIGASGARSCWRLPTPSPLSPFCPRRMTSARAMLNHHFQWRHMARRAPMQGSAAEADDIALDTACLRALTRMEWGRSDQKFDDGQAGHHFSQIFGRTEPRAQ